MLGADTRGLTLRLDGPEALAAGTTAEMVLGAAFAGPAVPRRVELALEAEARLGLSPARAWAPVEDGRARGRFSLSPSRRGLARVRRAWARWRGPFGLVWKQAQAPLDRGVAVTLNLQAVKDEAMRLLSRDAPLGVRLQRDLGDGSEFHALRDFQTGMDRRAIDWKQSARHGLLLAKEFQAERNHPVMQVIDTGRLMCEPVLGLARIDHALNAALLMAYVSLKAGDLSGLFAFDERPRLSAGPLAGAGAFSQLQGLAATLDYAEAETNYTLGLAQLAARLRRRALLVVFTEFAATTSAELMLEAVGRLLDQHLVLFVVMRDAELEALAAQSPQVAEDVSRASVAAALLREREVVIERLQRMGAQVLEAPADQLGPALVSRYLSLKRRDLL